MKTPLIQKVERSKIKNSTLLLGSMLLLAITLLVSLNRNEHNLDSEESVGVTLAYENAIQNYLKASRDLRTAMRDMKGSEKVGTQEDSKERPADHAGSWYAKSPEDLKKEFEEWSSGIKPQKGVRVVISPHAGDDFCGKNKVVALSYVDPKAFKSAIILGTSHYQGSRCAASTFTSFDTPFGELKRSTGRLYDPFYKICDPLTTKNDEKEHSFEMMLPMIAYHFGTNFKVFPMTFTGVVNDAFVDALAEIIRQKDVLVVISSDFTHYGPNYDYEFKDMDDKQINSKITSIDHNYMKIISRDDIKLFQDNMDSTSICGRDAILAMLQAQEKAHLPLLWTFPMYTRSTMIGKHRNSVSYVAGVGVQGDRACLLNKARAVLKGLRPLSESCTSLKAGCFVTFDNEKGELRGCVGTFYVGSLDTCVVNMAKSALKDDRFEDDRIKPDEKIVITISILGPELPIENLEDMKIGHDGIHMFDGEKSLAVYLPEVAVDWKWDHPTVEKELCKKSGLPEDCGEGKTYKVFSSTTLKEPQGYTTALKSQ